MTVCGHDCESDSKMQYYRPYHNKIDEHRYTIGSFSEALSKHMHFPVEKTMIPRSEHQTR